MAETFNISFYKIEKCGYYARGSHASEFCEIKDTLNELKHWAFQDGMTLGETCTFSPEDYNEDINPTYCFNLIDINQEDYLLVTWNQIPSVEGQVASVPSLEPVGNAEVSLTELPEDSIPGFATYFWFIPDREIFACIQLPKTLNGRKNLEKYLKDFLSKATTYVVTRDNTIIGYRKDSTDETRLLHPSFESKPYRKLAEIEYLRSQREQIRKIIKKDKLSFLTQQNISLWQLFLSKIGISEPAIPHEEDINFKFEINHCPTEMELNDIITAWERESSATRWTDTGFRLKGENKTRWLSHSLARSEVPLDVTRTNEELVNAQSLLEELVRRKDELLALLG